MTIRKEDTKRKPSAWRTMPHAPAAFFINEFCAAHRLSPSMYFKLRSVGKAPAEMQVGRRRMVSVEAAEAWRRECEVLNDSD